MTAGREAADPDFEMLADNAAEAGLPWKGPPVVRRVEVEVAPGRPVSALQWGSGPAEMVLLHGGAQNAHTWDTVALVVDRPLVALDLPGHGHSGWRGDGDYQVASLATDVAAAIGRLAPRAELVVGMSLGGLVALAVAAEHPELVRRLALVDITPGTDSAKTEPILAFLSGPESFASFEEMLARTVAFNPRRSVSSLRRGVVHNAREGPDGRWRWRWDPAVAQRSRPAAAGFGSLWPAVDRLGAPLVLLRGERSRVVTDDDVAELRRRQPTAQVEVIAGAGHSIQGDQPVALAEALARVAAGRARRPGSGGGAPSLP
ncbi:MAG TPA: alpha/beta hydrolase [Acidimicrobiales bacterium]|nr:alpha/beta hydrolase [Acidimicrobiales bacterium]